MPSQKNLQFNDLFNKGIDEISHNIINNMLAPESH